MIFFLAWTGKQADDGQRVIRKAHFSFQLRWVKIITGWYRHLSRLKSMYFDQPEQISYDLLVFTSDVCCTNIYIVLWMCCTNFKVPVHNWYQLCISDFCVTVTKKQRKWYFPNLLLRINLSWIALEDKEILQFHFCLVFIIVFKTSKERRTRYYFIHKK